jgi:hypothetical protein
MTRKSTIKIDTQQFLDTVVGAVVGNGLVPKGQADFAKARGDKRLIVVAAAPKSGSTYLVNTLMQITGLRGFRLCAAYSTNEHDLYLPALCLMNPYGCVSQLHMKGTFHNAALMRSFGIRPIVLVRRIDDIVVSLQHDLREKAKRPTFGTGQHGYSFVWPDQCMKDLSEERLADMIIDLAVPWFVNFYVSWYRLCEQGAVDALWITYEQMFAEKERTLRQVLEFLGIRNIGAIDQDILSRRYRTFRDGRSGRGVSVLTARQQARIREQFSYYPTIDFGRYGIGITGSG